MNAANLGIGITQFRAKVFLFEQMRYDRVMFFEDDLVLGPTYVRTLQLMLDQFERGKSRSGSLPATAKFR